ncbi:MAG: hypothetical protein JWR63_1256 [Conexibacter sp.]|nr:hypothetical protein [Conexibacter sp.]
MQSAQEIFVKTMLEFGLGAGFLFEPAEFTKGGPGSKQGRGEPADLVWWCRDTAFVFCMQETSRPFERAEAHNLKQLRGVTRVWEKGRPIVGENTFRSFHLTAAEVKHLVRVSVVKAPGAMAWVTPEPVDSRHTTETRVLASLPQGVLQRLAELGGSALDLADLMLHLSSLPGPISEAYAVALVEQHRLADIGRAAEDPTIREDRDDVLDREIALSIVDGMRHGPADVLHSPTGSFEDAEPLAALNDLDWESTRVLIRKTADVIRCVRDVPRGAYGPTVAMSEIGLDRYLFIVAAGESAQMAAASEKILAHAQQRTQERPDNPPFTFSYLLVGRPEVEYMSSVMSVPSQLGPTMTSLALRAMYDATV